MRRVGVVDLHQAARAVAAQPAARRAAFGADLCWRAHVADKFVKRLRRPHPVWGDGSLRSAALGCQTGGELLPNSAVLQGCVDVLKCLRGRIGPKNTDR